MLKLSTCSQCLFWVPMSILGILLHYTSQRVKGWEGFFLGICLNLFQKRVQHRHPVVQIKTSGSQLTWWQIPTQRNDVPNIQLLHSDSRLLSGRAMFIIFKLQIFLFLLKWFIIIIIIYLWNV